MFFSSKMGSQHHPGWATLSLLLMRMRIVLSLRLMYIRQQNGYQLSLESKQHRLIECLANNHKSSCMLAHGYRKGDERLSLPRIGAEWKNKKNTLDATLTIARDMLKCEYSFTYLGSEIGKNGCAQKDTQDWLSKANLFKNRSWQSRSRNQRPKDRANAA